MNTRRDTFDEMNRFFDMARFFEPFGQRMGDIQTVGNAVRMEQVDGAYRVLADLPGFEREQIGLTYDDGVLTLTAEADEQTETRSQRRSIYERVTIPEDVHHEEITATYRNGVLEVTLPLADPDTDDTLHIDID